MKKVMLFREAGSAGEQGGGSEATTATAPAPKKEKSPEQLAKEKEAADAKAEKDRVKALKVSKGFTVKGVKDGQPFEGVVVSYSSNENILIMTGTMTIAKADIQESIEPATAQA